MARKLTTIHLTGPYITNDTDSEFSGVFTGETQDAIMTEGQIFVETAPTKDEHVIRNIDVADFVEGPASATDEKICVFDGTTGKLIKENPGTIYPQFGRVGVGIAPTEWQILNVYGDADTGRMIKVRNANAGNSAYTNMFVQNDTSKEAAMFIGSSTYNAIAILSGKACFYSANWPSLYGSYGAFDVEFMTNNAVRMTIDSNGKTTFGKEIVKATKTVTATGPTDNLDAAGVNIVKVDTSSNNVTIGGFVNGSDGQELKIVIVDATNNTILEHAEGTGNQDIYLASGGDETKTAGYGGWTLICNGTHWYEVG